MSYLYPFRNLDFSLYTIISFDLPNWIGYSTHTKFLKIELSNKVIKSIIDFYKIDSVSLMIADSYGTALCVYNLNMFNNIVDLVLVSPIVKDFRLEDLPKNLLKLLKFQPFRLLFRSVFTKSYDKTLFSSLNRRLKRDQLNEYVRMANELNPSELLNYLIDLSSIDLEDKFKEVINKVNNVPYILSPVKEGEEFKTQIELLKNSGLKFDFRKIKGDHNDFMTLILAEEIDVFRSLLTFTK